VDREGPLGGRYKVVASGAETAVATVIEALGINCDYTLTRRWYCYMEGQEAHPSWIGPRNRGYVSKPRALDVKP
jgi:hypothetical protein